MADISIPVSSWNRFLVRNFRIEPRLAGARHEFTYDHCKVLVQLPSNKYLPKEPFEGEILSFNTYRESDGEIIPVYLRVHVVDITISCSEKIVVNGEIANHPPNAYNIVPKSQQESLDVLAGSHSLMAEKVFDLWIRILRWKSRDGGIGRPRVIGHESGWGTHLVADSDGKQIWNFREPEILWIGEPVVTAEIWNTVESAIQSDKQPPVFIELMYDAVEHVRLGDLQRATVDMAVACECYLRKLVTESLPNGLTNSLSGYVDDANIRTVLTKFIPDLLNDEERQHLKRIESRLHKLFNVRNDILHTGRNQALSANDCAKFLDATRALIDIKN